MLRIFYIFIFYFFLKTFILTSQLGWQFRNNNHSSSHEKILLKNKNKNKKNMEKQSKTHMLTKTQQSFFITWKMYY